MQSRHYKLRSDKEEDDGRDLEELAQVDPHAALHKHHAKDDCQRDSDQSAQETQQFAGVEADCGKDQYCLYALAQDHQENEKEHSDFRSRGRQPAELRLDLPFMVLPAFIMKTT